MPVHQLYQHEQKSRPTRTLDGKTIIMSSGSRGGLGIALRTARDLVNIAMLAKIAESPLKLEGTARRTVRGGASEPCGDAGWR